MPSFDIVSELKKDELQNAVDNANRELQSRYDFRGVEASYTLVKAENLVKGIEVTCAEFKDITRSGKRSLQQVVFKEGIDKELGKKIVKLIKDAKLKVDAKMNDDTVRVQGKKRDDLQAAIAAVKAKAGDLGQPLQFNNFRD